MLNRELVATSVRKSTDELGALCKGEVRDSFAASLATMFLAWKDNICWPVIHD